MRKTSKPASGSTTGRRFFRLDEAVSLRIKTAAHRAVITLTASGGRRRQLTAPAAGGWAYFTIEPNGLSAGEWKVFSGRGGREGRAREGPGGRASFAFTVVPCVARTPFAVAVFQANLDYDKPPWCQQDMPIERRIAALRDEYGVNTLMWWYIYSWPQWVSPAHPCPPGIEPQTADRIIQMQGQFLQLNTVARMHQPGREENDWSSPEAIEACRYTVRLAAQRWRPYGGFIGIHLADEPGLTWGKMAGDGSLHAISENIPEPRYVGPLAVQSQLDAYEKAAGRKAPEILAPHKDPAAWKEYMRWRCTILRDAFATLAADVKAVDDRLISTSQAYEWTGLGDGIYLRQEAAGLDILCTHAYPDRQLGMWYPAEEIDCIRTGSGERPLWHIPLWAGCTPPEGVRMAVFSALARKIDGLIWSTDQMMGFPQAREVMRQILPISGMLAAAQKHREEAAIFFSREQLIHDYMDQVTAPALAGRQYTGRINIAWLMAAAAHYSTDQLVEEDLLAGGASHYKVILVPGLTHSTPQIVAALERCAEQGCAVLLDQSATVQIRGAVHLPFAFESVWDLRDDRGYAPDREVWDRLIAPHLADLAGAMGGYLAPIAQCDNPMFLLSLQDADGGAYLWAVNMAEEMPAEQPPTGRRNQWNVVPAKAHLTLPQGYGAIYDVFAHKRVDEKQVDLDFQPGQAAIYAMTPSAIDELRIDRFSFASPQFHLAASIRNDLVRVDAVVPLVIELTAPDGATTTLYRATRHGRYEEALAIGHTPVAGPWQVKVTDLASGLAATATTLAAAGGSEIVQPPFTVELVDAQRIALALRPEKGPVLVIHGDGLKAPAERLAKSLRRHGCQASATGTGNYLDHKVDLDHSIWPLEPLPLDINRQVILLGDCDNNPVLHRLVRGYCLCPRQLDDAYPGKGRALVYWAGAVFGLDSDVVAVYAADPAGVRAGIDRLIQLLDQ